MPPLFEGRPKQAKRENNVFLHMTAAKLESSQTSRRIYQDVPSILSMS
jgi:hypothetical protein